MQNMNLDGAFQLSMVRISLAQAVVGCKLDVFALFFTRLTLAPASLRLLPLFLVSSFLLVLFHLARTRLAAHALDA
jgi:hypothetical protein